MSLPLRQMVRRGELPRHRHAEAYVAVVLAGAYEEAGDRGRRRLTAGDVVIHAGWEAHLNRTSASAQVLNLPLDLPGLAPFGAIDDLDRLASLAERDLTAARDFLTQALRPRTASLFDWPELLADALASGERPARCDPRYRDFIDFIVLDRRASQRLAAFEEHAYATGALSDHCAITARLRVQ